MTLTLKESNAVVKIAEVLYDFLPGTPHKYGVKRLSFPAIAEDLGLGNYWTGGSKLPAISKLLELTLEHKRGEFCKLLIEIVRRGNEKRRKSNPVTYEEIESLNASILGVGFKIPELHDPEFLKSLPRKTPEPEKGQQRLDLSNLGNELTQLTSLPPQQRGYAFEKLLSALFHAYSLMPRAGFRNNGEQIDGSFELNDQTYLLEAKWQSTPVGQSELLTFQGKVEGKAAWARGMFVSYSGFSPDGLAAFRTGRSTKIVCMDGFDLWEIISNGLSFIDAISRKTRRASESNEAYVPIRELFPER